MKLLSVLSVLFASTSFAASCPTDIVASCAIQSQAVCMELQSNGIQHIGEMQQSCLEEGGVFSTNACATAGVVGSCHIEQQGVGMLLRLYSPMEAIHAQMMCQQAQGNLCN